MSITDIVSFVNPILWVISNVLVVYIGVLLTVFVISYQLLFDPRATTGGKLIFRFSFSLLFVIGLVLIGIFADPLHGMAWFQYPGDTVWWRPVLRALGYGYVAYTITSLVWFLFLRKFNPDKLRTARDKQLVQPRVETSEIPTTKVNRNV